MRPLQPIFKWLVFAALADWFIMRTVTRTAIFMPKTPAMITVYEGLTTAGLYATTLCGLFVLGALGSMAWQHWQATKRAALPLLWMSLLILSLAFIFVLPVGGLVLGYYALFLLALLAVGKQIYRTGGNLQNQFAETLPVLALVVGALYQLMPALYEVFRWPGPPVFSQTLFNVGELIIVLCPIVWWWVYGRGAPWKTWLVGSLPALVFTAMRLTAPAMTGTVAVWSVGLTLYLPWPLYVVSLWLFGVTVIALLRGGNPAGWAFILLAVSGYAPQLSTQLLAELVALWLFASRTSVSAGVKAPDGKAMVLEASLWRSVKPSDPR